MINIKKKLNYQNVLLPNQIIKIDIIFSHYKNGHDEQIHLLSNLVCSPLVFTKYRFAFLRELVGIKKWLGTQLVIRLSSNSMQIQINS